ncbi:uncharacterized protein MONOS_13476 [Monocercomonoides exilis]|uniref:uncharacterized protein n=1 Tax=Monocercomonoides exilis TaxID=2049356 RepID=UPI003559C29F|nr:hypothetical protein MONOS_13476 [Monocercomonoides exilis]|eukprot:MONOS_13476.1-p1 / transcript=MONOS_13476.1 / gene=MONOS_13476 / organism=Monocercomonoides_exilis_PA203 / gene_product=unspecified product / transcript_product=unspecified product / location=Mono_scaffold00834:21057-22349(-) / protein_length=431 / sequence_SO=supercontig / SO=protein_coding / is_pseudo=false
MFLKFVLIQVAMMIHSQDVSAIGLTDAFVKNSGSENSSGASIDHEKSSLKDAYDLLADNEECHLMVVDDAAALKAEPITFNKSHGITIEGIESNGYRNTEATIDCAVSASSVLFNCAKHVEFKHLAFNFPMSRSNKHTIIGAGSNSISLTITKCRFVRVNANQQNGAVVNANAYNLVANNLMRVTAGVVTLNSVTCQDEKETVTFSISPFSFIGASEVSLFGVAISKVNVLNGAAISIKDLVRNSTKVVIEGLNVTEVNSKGRNAGGLQISLVSEESTAEIGRMSKCSFKSCTAPNGKSGAVFVKMPQAMSHLQLPSANNLDIDRSNIARSSATSLFISAPDFEDFCDQEDAFEFAQNNYEKAELVKGEGEDYQLVIDTVVNGTNKLSDMVQKSSLSDKNKSISIIIITAVGLALMVALVIGFIISKLKD